MSSALQAFSDQLVALIERTRLATVTVSGMSTSLLQGGAGSGWLYDERGHIVTNAHVVEGMTRLLEVQFAGNRAQPATIVGVDSAYDLAVIRCELSDATRRPLAIRPVPAKLGEVCVALGSPLRFRESVSLGIVSGLSRQLSTGTSTIEEVLQTDAAINPGNSGGPLVDCLGAVIGVNVARRADADNIGFAIAAELVLDTVPELIAHGSIVRGTMGISIAESWADDGSARQVITVQKINTAQSLFQAGDIILAIDDQPVTRRYDVRKKLNRQSIGSTVTVAIQRAGAFLSIPVVVSVRS
ncbi:MAG: hypothetical protein RLY87_1766 [Chloroflexota bacterium]|jgi:S1-C subfamily serine protease